MCSFPVGDAPSLPKGWEVKKLGEVCKISTGKSNANQAVSNGQYAFFDRSKKTKRSNRYLFDCDALIIPGEGATFFPKHYFGKFDLHQRAYAIFNFNKDININFIEYYLIFEHKYFERVAVGATVKSLRLRHFQELQIPLPPLPEQKRIVAILDQAFTAINKAKTNTEQNLKNARELFQSALQTEFENGKSKIENGEWEEKKLGEVCKVERGSSPRPIKKYFTDEEDGVNWIKIGDTKGVDKYIYSTRQKITKAGAEKSRHVKEDDFILSNSMSFGKPFIMKTTGYIHDGWFVLRLHDFIDTDYFFILLSSSYIREQFNKLASGSVVKNISGDLVKKVILPIPPLPEQKTIVKKSDAISTETKKLETIYQQKINDLDELKKSILQKAFSGEL